MTTKPTNAEFIKIARNDANCWGTDKYESRVVHAAMDRLEESEQLLTDSVNKHGKALQRAYQAESRVKELEAAQKGNVLDLVIAETRIDDLTTALQRINDLTPRLIDSHPYDDRLVVDSEKLQHILARIIYD